MTVIYELDPYSLEIYRMRENELPTSSLSRVIECVHLVTGGHFRSRDKDGGHTIQSVTAENAMIHWEPYSSLFCRSRVMSDQSFTVRE